MTKRTIALIMVFSLGAAASIGLFLTVSPQSRQGFQKQTRAVIPQRLPAQGNADPRSRAGRTAFDPNETNRRAKNSLQEGETLIAVLPEDFNRDTRDEQIIAYQNQGAACGPLAVAAIAYDPSAGEYRRVWSAPTAVERPETLSLSAADLIGDRSLCLIVRGMNEKGEHTMSLFRKPPPAPGGGGLPFTPIGEIVMDGPIRIQEAERSPAYRQGNAKGQSFTIAAYTRDRRSPSGPDQTAIIYAYDPRRGRYEPPHTNKLPEPRAEAQQARKPPSGSVEEFETLISGLWYDAGPQDLGDTRRSIYFDPKNRELIFYDHETQQVFTWLHSRAARNGVSITGQNISVASLRRFLTIEFESLESIRLSVSEELRLKIGVTNAWDGSYRKAGKLNARQGQSKAIRPYTRARYESARGSFAFFQDGNYELHAKGIRQKGTYAFFSLQDQEVLALRPGARSGQGRETFLVKRNGPEDLTLIPTRLSTSGFQEVHEAPVALRRFLGDEMPPAAEPSPPILR